MAKIIVVGASGTIGGAVADSLAQRHEVMRVGNRSGEFTVDLSAKASIEELFQAIGVMSPKTPRGFRPWRFLARTWLFC